MASTLKHRKIRAVFFHGSGGSVSRGGGRIKEQLSWWPEAAVHRPKLTLQGEMIQRTFATEEILDAYCTHFVKEASSRKGRHSKPHSTVILDHFCQSVQSHYQALVQDKSLLDELLKASPYHYLDALKIGSRPSSRAPRETDISTLRAIPWVLCWTQNRLLLPTWWGTGSAWKALNDEQKDALKKLYTHDSFFSSSVKSIGFSLAKVRLDVGAMYLKVLSPKQHKRLLEMLRAELELSRVFLREVSGSQHLIPDRRWLEESIRIRSPYIHILNLLQICAITSEDEDLLRETVIGIACGMLTTG